MCAIWTDADSRSLTVSTTVTQHELDDFYEAFKAASPDGKAVTLAEFTKVFQAMGIRDPLVIEHTFHGV
jgi:hypothetical protein